MSALHLVTLSFEGRPFYIYATDRHPGEANHDAGNVMDRLTDYYGRGFSYAVTPLQMDAGDVDRFDVVATAHESGNGNPLNLER